MSDRVAIVDHGRLIQVGPPKDLYRQPSSRFVAEFLGETNLIPGTVSRASDEGVEIRSSIGTLKASHGIGSGEVLCSLRPEAVKLGIGTIRGVVQEAVYLGETAQMAILVGTSVLRASVMNPRDIPVPGKDTWISIDPDDVAVIPLS